MKSSFLNKKILSKNKPYFQLIIFICILGPEFSCKKFVEIPPPTDQLVTSTVFSSDATATDAVLGIYISMMQDKLFASVNTTLYTGLSSDELTDYSNDAGQKEFYTNSINPSNSDNAGLWSNAYQYIYAANAVIEGVNDSSAVSALLRPQLRAEAKFIRAFCYFYLTNLFGDVPLITHTEYLANTEAARISRNEIYLQIIEDLKEAQTYLPVEYLDANNSPTSERVRPIRFAASALLARVYLFQKDWSDAEGASDDVINQTDLYSLSSDLNAVFLKNSTESIWQLQPVNPNWDTFEGLIFILTGTPSGSFATALTNSQLNSFEPGDMRRINWVDSVMASGDTFYYAFKYKIATYDPNVPEYSMVFRLAEQYLIRAECRAEQNNLSGAADDLNMIRNRAGLPNTTASDLSSFRTAILHERQTELFVEWGHRWFDLKRTGNAGNVLSIVKPNWSANDSLYPVPITEIKNDPNISQNPGY